jgi:hypothetical protein
MPSLLLFFHHSSDIWEYGHKVAFDGPNKLILINRDVTDINVRTDIYSDWKEWVRLRDNAKYLQALRVTGGDSLGGGETLGGQWFLVNGWRLRTWEGDHTLNVNENIRVDEDDPDLATNPNAFVRTLGNHEILINLAVSQISNVLTVEVSGSSSSSGSFESADRTTLNNIETIVQSMQTDVARVLSSSFIASGNVLSGSTSNEIKTSLSAPDNRYNGMFVIVTDSDGGESRTIEQYNNASGTLFVEPPLSYTPQPGDNVVVIGAGHVPSFGKGG